MMFTEYDIAICGMAFSLPDGINSPSKFRDLRQKNASVIRDYRSEFDSSSDQELFHCGFIDELYLFPYKEFGLSKKHAAMMDPQQRMLLKLSKHALLDAGSHTINPGNRTGCFLSSGINYYLLDNILKHGTERLEMDISSIMRLNDSSFTSTRVANTLGLQGPAMTVQSACSSSLSAVHLGCQSLLSGESDQVLVGACSLLLPQHRRFIAREEDILSNDGSCRPLDMAATGTVASSGGAVFLLKPACVAAEQGDKIYAVIKATSMNNDGGGKTSFGAPSIFGQKTVMEEGLALANLKASQLSYHELHGTATLLGDVIEMESTSSAFQLSETDSVALGAIKSQIGHTDTASGMFGILNCIYSLAHQTAHPIANFSQFNPKLVSFTSGFSEPGKEVSLSNSEEDTLYGSVSSFGIGGTNGFAVIAVNSQCTGFHTDYKPQQWSNEQECLVPIQPAENQEAGSSGTDKHEPVNYLTESTLLKILEELLEEEITDDSVGFYDLGGDSILLLDFIDIIKKETGTKPALREMVESPSIKDLLQYAINIQKIEPKTSSEDSDGIGSNDIASKNSQITQMALNEQQKRLWLYSKMHPDSDAMNIANIFEIGSCVSACELQEILGNWIARHPILNCHIAENQGELYWEVNETAIEASVSPKASKPVAIGKMKRELLLPLCIDGKLSKLMLHEIKGGWLIGFCIHHAIIDGIQLRSMTAELRNDFGIN
ncbi:hypothetical protein IFO68_21235 [Photobacterium sp. CAU 1568]|uniref:Carrier domain-containing protein n=1 Tax=Photobacterium arenosum TaxID=2774143 RepID=A0ABR9BRK5_9GAMM|nr:beta-ketoacyl synthase N-terminal-like domain-containing protein [Photobacterium arenosum]MBD8515205.1 hypothetical protein [Photobacterium arenosum]